jgi:hypothetical protein
VFAVGITLIAIAIIFAISLPAQAHSARELNDWLLDWDQRFEEQWMGVVGEVRDALLEPLILEREDMLERHPGWDGNLIEIVVPVSHRSSSSSSGSGSSGANRGMGSNVEQWRGLVSAYDWNVDIALCLMARESGGNPNAQNKSSGASGLMQVLPSWAPKFGYDRSDLFIPEVNLEISYALYVDGGWNHWSPWKRGACH